MKVETVEEYLARGGKIKYYRSRADEIAAKAIPTGKYCQRDAYFRELARIKQESQERKRRWKKIYCKKTVKSLWT